MDFRMILTTFQILVWLIFVIGGNLAWHIIGIVKFKSKPNYWVTWIFRWGAMVFFGAWFMGWGTEWYPGLELWSIEIWPAIGFGVCSFLLIFNPAMNFLKNKYADAKKVGFWDLGKTSGFIFDRLFLRFPWLYKGLYFACIPGMIYSVYKMYLNQ
jgi:hypothetical protein